MKFPLQVQYRTGNMRRIVDSTGAPLFDVPDQHVEKTLKLLNDVYDFGFKEGFERVMRNSGDQNAPVV